MQRIDVPVLIVGAGPVGLTAGLLLSRMGIDSRIVERRPGPQRAPAAHVVNARTLEIFRQAGADMDAIGAAAKDPCDAGSVYWVDKLGGQILGRLPFERQGDDMLAVTPTPLRNISQHRLEPILVDSLARAGAARPHYSHQWDSSQQSCESVVSRIQALHTGESYQVRSRYVLAADGAGSRIRKWLGIAQLGPERIQSFVMIHFRADLRALVRDCPGVLYWICDPRAGGILVAHDIDREWVYMHSFDPDSESLDSYDSATCEALVRRALAVPQVDLTIATISAWTMSAQVAARYRQGRVFLVGDAAHRFPPTGGLGLNTGVQDVHNLAWKLAAVIGERGTDALLDTYETERQPVARNNADQSLTNAMRMLQVPEALGTIGDREAATLAFQQTMADPAARQNVADAIAGQAEHFDMPGLQLGFSYEDGALVSDATAKPEAANPVRDFVPSSRPGARLPHGWVEREGLRVSTLDLIAPVALTLLAGPQAAAWVEAAHAIDPGITCLVVGQDIVDPDNWWRTAAGMQPQGVLLVRPDQHVAFRSQSRGGDMHVAMLHAVATVFGHPGADQAAAAAQ